MPDCSQKLRAGGAEGSESVSGPFFGSQLPAPQSRGHSEQKGPAKCGCPCRWSFFLKKVAWVQMFRRQCQSGAVAFSSLSQAGFFRLSTAPRALLVLGQQLLPLSVPPEMSCLPEKTLYCSKFL